MRWWSENSITGTNNKNWLLNTDSSQPWAITQSLPLRKDGNYLKQVKLFNFVKVPEALRMRKARVWYQGLAYVRHTDFIRHIVVKRYQFKSRERREWTDLSFTFIFYRKNQKYGGKLKFYWHGIRTTSILRLTHAVSSDSPYRKKAGRSFIAGRPLKWSQTPWYSGSSSDIIENWRMRSEPEKWWSTLKSLQKWPQ